MTETAHPYYMIELRSTRHLILSTHWWRIVSTLNGQTIATSETYLNRSNMRRGAREFSLWSGITIKDDVKPVIDGKIL